MLPDINGKEVCQRVRMDSALDGTQIICISGMVEQEKIADLRKRLTTTTHDLGEVVDTEVFAPKDVGRHVQRLYGVIYFQKRPLWLRAEYYTIEGRGGFISFEFSREASDILPIELNVATR
jgi:CheY-like chemotaxis protein